jgi:hypothetical protein
MHAPRLTESGVFAHSTSRCGRKHPFPPITLFPRFPPFCDRCRVIRATISPPSPNQTFSPPPPHAVGENVHFHPLHSFRGSLRSATATKSEVFAHSTSRCGRTSVSTHYTPSKAPSVLRPLSRNPRNPRYKQPTLTKSEVFAHTTSRCGRKRPFPPIHIYHMIYIWYI